MSSKIQTSPLNTSHETYRFTDSDIVLHADENILEKSELIKNMVAEEKMKNPALCNKKGLPEVTFFSFESFPSMTEREFGELIIQIIRMKEETVEYFSNYLKKGEDTMLH